ncbi:bifunctional [glutamate--ammonia ligase]-adenylyl-L-tyrosine phosphorylase/[glutamate--ammonia-ligase] adenylyltransferase [Mitsuaria sp. BK037]|uniref:bifunctional [glutamate--ammonia ligase]-adenylyl-L-tyrosine phosphorylase/[glutamate--ammonia-ligase] adenylyltransferase n=1 Tax=Mitsuaria sp. BK037 TaxID=2587122 RepID=UPI00161F25DD|nr:bifunctional [glutamate--ammonia ligase]-adenylyl-L-tyrosine phosphorylase/[glutamate--ammonia-ligase] adenylyltransferase [Mitsuaria sp. BK037]
MDSVAPATADPAGVSTPAASADHSRFVQRIRRRYAAELPLLPPGLPDDAVMRAVVDRLCEGGRALPAALRVMRQLVMERLAVLDVEQGAPMTDVTQAMTHLAEVALDIGVAHCRAELDALYGPPRDAVGQDIDFWVVGMGKLGGRELNVSSDIDLIYVYEDDGQTEGPDSGTGRQRISAHEYFAQLSRRLSTLIGDVTEDGQVFRVDLALRPNGNSGPPAVSMAMLEEYFLVQGREWERFAWLKSRVVAPRASVKSGRAMQLRSLVTPFVYRRYLDYGVFEGLRQLHRKIRDEAQRRAAGRPERANDVKLSRGGIREIEFIVQLLQVVRGGQFPEIRTRSTLKALTRLAARGLMKPETATALAKGYDFLRRVEHRIQYLDDQQTHCLPASDEDIGWIARSLCLSCNSHACPLLDRLMEVRELVATEFDALLHDGVAPGKGSCKNGMCGGPPLPIDSEEFLDKLQPELAANVRRWAQQARVQNLREDSRLRLAKLVGRAALAVRQGECTLDAAQRFVDWIEPLLRRESYLALLVERPAVQGRLLRLLGLARWPMRYLMQHPGVIDELADARLLHERFDGAAFIQDLQARHDAWAEHGEASEDALLDSVRRAHHAEVFRTLVRDVEGQISVEQVADELSLLADATVQCVLDWAWDRLKQKHRPSPRLAVIAYGKLGGKELGYGSDLDLVFLFDDEDDNAAEIYGAFIRKLITWLTIRTAAGELFDIDTALRPNGNSGLLVTSITSFENYQGGRGSNTAWTWEHQAITRARFCAGDASLAERFEATRRAVLTAPRDPAALRDEVVAMREKLRVARSVRTGFFDVKHSPGGMVDAEFALQYLILAHSARHPELLANAGNIALLQRAESAGLLPANVGRDAADAYRELRRVQHRARLNEQSTALDGEAAEALAPQRDAVLALWRAVFG